MARDNGKEVNVLSRAYDIGYDDGYYQGMIGAYDDYGNVVDMVKWEEKIRAKAIEKFAESLKSRLGDAIYTQDVESMRNLIDDMVKEQNNG